MFSQDFREFIELLIKNKAEYLIVGGYAVGIHGHPRYTGDLDIWLNPTPKNAEQILKSVNEFGFSSFKLTQEDFTKPGNVIQLGYPPLRIDILTDIDGVDFKTCFQNKVIYNEDDTTVFFISKDDLIKNKKASGRHKDLGDIEQLS